MRPLKNYRPSSKELSTQRLTSFSTSRLTWASKTYIGWYLTASTSEDRYQKIVSKNWCNCLSLLSPQQTTQKDFLTTNRSAVYLDAFTSHISNWTSRYMKHSRKLDKRPNLVSHSNSPRRNGQLIKPHLRNRHHSLRRHLRDYLIIKLSRLSLLLLLLLYNV